MGQDLTREHYCSVEDQEVGEGGDLEHLEVLR